MTKVLLLLLLVVAVVLLWRSGRRRNGSPPSTKTTSHTPPETPVQMVRCKVCQVHLARSDAIVAPTGTYCSDAHYRLDDT